MPRAQTDIAARLFKNATRVQQQAEEWEAQAKSAKDPRRARLFAQRAAVKRAQADRISAAAKRSQAGAPGKAAKKGKKAASSEE